MKKQGQSKVNYVQYFYKTNSSFVVKLNSCFFFLFLKLDFLNNVQAITCFFIMHSFQQKTDQHLRCLCELWRMRSGVVKSVEFLEKENILGENIAF